MLEQYRKVNGMATFNSNKLEPKYGWGHAQFKTDLADKIESLKIDPSWRPHEITRYIAKIVRDS
jgi:hypothetical protein